MKQRLFSKKILLFLIPLAFFLTIAYNLKEMNLASIRSVDPEYIHLTSSVNLANGQYELLSIENPATSLYIFNAVIVKITYVITGNNKDLMNDFLLSPEKYVSTVRASLILITAFSLICLGLIAYKHTGNLIQALFLQIIPFISIEILNSCTMICPEHFLVIIMIWYTAMLLILKERAINENRSVIYFSIIVAIGLATKLTFVPLLIPPLFLFSKNKFRIYYLLLTCAITLPLVFPVVIQHERFFAWVSGLIFHSGQYGTGTEQIVDVNLFWVNLKNIFSTEVLFSATFLLLILTLLLILFFKKKKDGEFTFFLAIAIVFTIQIALASKHFAFRYLIPSMMLTTYVIYELSSWYILHYKFHWVKKMRIFFSCSVILIFGFGLFNLIQFNIKYENHRESRIGAYNYIENNLPGQPMLIIPNYFGSAAMAYSLHFSAVWTGKYREIYFNELNKLYPNTYFYFPWTGKFTKWNSETSLFEILNKYKKLYVYAALDAKDRTEEDFNLEIKKKFNYYNLKGNIIRIKEMYSSKYDVIYELNIDRNKLNNLYDYEEIKCDMENLSQDGKHFETNTNYQFSFNDNRNSTAAFSGNYSQFLDKNHPYGSSIKIDDVKPGSHYEITLWKKSTDTNCMIVATAENPDDLYVSSNYVNQAKDGWEQLKLTFDADKKIEKKSIQIYSWYNGEDHVFVDDFQITIGTIQE